MLIKPTALIIKGCKMRVRREVSEIIDGDTFKVRGKVLGSQYIRLAGINAPEKNQRGHAYAKNLLSEMVGKVVTIEPVGKSYGRTVARVPYATHIFKNQKQHNYVMRRLRLRGGL